MTIAFILEKDLRTEWLHQRDLMLRQNLNKSPIEAQAELERIQILRNIQKLSDLVTKEDMAMAKTLDDVITEVTAQKTVADSLVVFVQGLKQQLTDALAANDPTKIQAIIDGLDANTKEISDATVANTPAAPTT